MHGARSQKYAKDASGQNCGKATFTQGQTVALAFHTIAFSQPTKVGATAPVDTDPTQYKSWVRDRSSRRRGPQARAIRAPEEAGPPRRSIQASSCCRLKEEPGRDGLGHSTTNSLLPPGSQISSGPTLHAEPEPPCTVTTTTPRPRVNPLAPRRRGSSSSMS